jgi:membrane fusion protein (multidrug efflux system)
MNTTSFSAVNGNAARVGSLDDPIVQPPLPNGEGRIELNDDKDSTNRPSNYRRFFKRAALGAAIVFAVVGAAALAGRWWMVGRFLESTDDAYVGGDVTVIAPKVAGFIAQLPVIDNQPVRAGDLLIKLDDRDYHAALSRAEAAVAIQQATLTNFDALARLQQSVIAQAQAATAATSAELRRAHDDQARYRHLVSTGAVSTQSFQQADTDYKQALANDDKAQAALSAAQRQLDVIATQKQEAQAALHLAVAERDLAQLNLGYTELRAPMDGIVGNRSAQVGAYATIGSQLISLVPARGLWIDANFKESQIAEIHPGSPAIVKVDLISGKKFQGHVVSIAPATGAQFSVLPPENATGNFTKIVQRVAVRIVIDDDPVAQEQLRPGLSVVAKVDTRATGKAGL